MSTAVSDRCARCATKLRNTRTVCPSCGLDSAAPVAAAEESSAPPQIRKVAAKAGVKICPICMDSVRETELVEHSDGQKICASCEEKLKSKAVKKASGGGGPPR